MRTAPPAALTTNVQPLLTAHLSPAELGRLFPIDWSDVDPLAAAEPSRAALIRLDAGELVLVEYGRVTSTLTVSVPRDHDLHQTLASLLKEVPIPSAAIGWVATPMKSKSDDSASELQSSDQVVRHIALLIERGALRPGDRLAPERELAQELGVSRPTVRAGLHALAAMGVTESRQGAGTFITSGPPRLGAGPLGFLAALHGFTREQIFEARKVLEVGSAGLAAERGLIDRLAPMAEEIAGMFATLDDPQTYLVHDVRFHRAVGAAAGNPVLLALVEMVSSLVYEQRRLTVERAHDLKESAEMHRRIYQAIRDRDSQRAREEMAKHLDLARMAQDSEERNDVLASRVVGSPQAG